MKAWAKWTLIVAGSSLVVAPIATVTVYEQETEQRKKAALEALRALGHPTTRNEYLSTFPPKELDATSALSLVRREWNECGGPSLDSESPQLRAAMANGRLESFYGALEQFARQPEIKVPPPLYPASRADRDGLLLYEWAAVLDIRAQLDFKSGRHQVGFNRLRALRSLQELCYRSPAPGLAAAGDWIKALVNRTYLEVMSLKKDHAWRMRVYSEGLKGGGQQNLELALGAMIIGILETEIVAPNHDGMSLRSLPAVGRRSQVQSLEALAVLAEWIHDGAPDYLHIRDYEDSLNTAEPFTGSTGFGDHLQGVSPSTRSDRAMFEDLMDRARGAP